jgi:tetratricopeptide (TPR) repeat protein
MGISAALNNIGDLYNQMQEYERAIPYFQEDLALCTEASHAQGQAIANGNLASVLAALGRHEEAVRRFQEAIETDDRIGFLPHKAYNLQQLGESLIARGDSEAGCQALRQALALANQIQFPLVQEKASELLAACSDP